MLASVRDDLLHSEDTLQFKWPAICDRAQDGVEKNPDEANGIEVLSSLFLEYSTTADSLSTAFLSDLTDIISDAARPTMSSATSMNHPTTQIATQDSPHHCPPYIAPAYNWLLQNVHDPYPANHVKISISNTARAPLKHITSWFMNVRRRIGWTTISRKHFSGSRSDTVDAAFRALVKDDPKRPLGSNIILEFVEMKVSAENLYSERFRKSVLAGKLDAVVKDTTDGNRANNLTTRELTRESIQDAKTWAQSSYPSPDRSIQGSPKPPDSSSLILDTIPSSTANNKRPMDQPAETLCLEDCVLDTCQGRPKGRSRGTETSSRASPALCIALPPSPQSLCAETPIDLESWKSTSAQTDTVIDINSPVNRKRRLSDVDSYPLPKRPRGLHVGPRLQAVSDPLPLSNAVTEVSKVDSWFQLDFNLPEAVTAEDFDPLTPVEVDVFKDWTLFDGDAGVRPVQLDNGHATESLSSELSVATGCFDVTSLDMPSDHELAGIGGHDAEEFGASTSLNLPHIDGCGLFSHCDLGELTAADPLTSSIAVPCGNPPQDSFDIEAMLLHSYPSPSPCSASTLHCQPDLLLTSLYSSSLPSEFLNDTWTLCPPPCPSTEVTTTPSLQAFLDQILSQGLDPSLFLSLLPTPITTSSGQNNDQRQLVVDKQAKVEQLRKHQEEVRRLEAELAL